MGDRVHATFRLGGHVETVAECEMLIAAIANEGVSDNNRDHSIKTEEDAKTALRFAIESQVDPHFYDNECNYGTFDDIENVIGEIDGLAAHFTWDAGGGFPAGMKTIMPDNEEVSADGNDDPAISLTDLIKARQEDDALEAIDELISAANRAGGADMPSFTASPAVHVWLKIFAEPA